MKGYAAITQGQITRGKGIETRLFLAYNGKRWETIHKKMQPMPTVCQYAETTPRASHSSFKLKAISEVVNRPDWSIPFRTSKICYYSNRLLYKARIGRTSISNHIAKMHLILLKINHQ